MQIETSTNIKKNIIIKKIKYCLRHIRVFYYYYSLRMFKNNDIKNITSIFFLLFFVNLINNIFFQVYNLKYYFVR